VPRVTERLRAEVDAVRLDHALSHLRGILLDWHAGVFAIVNLMVQCSRTVDLAFAALADPTRRAVLERLGSGSATISELAEPFGMSLTGMKKHVRLLEEAELVTTEKVGRVRRCMLAPYAFEGISTWLQRLDRFAQVVERTKGAR
jgi:DNA-binding transcriptional ArsR family regulator